MKQERPYPKAIITKKGEASVKNGHPWIYEGEVISADEHENGCIVDAFGEKGNWLGAGFISDNSRIRVRLLSDNPNDKFDGAFFARRVGYAVSYRKTVMRFDFECCRLIFGEADGLPGVTVDRYGDLLVAEILSVGAERVKEHIYSALLSLIPGIRGIYERNESPLRVLEGIPQYKGWYGSAAHPVAGITENGILYDVDVENGQKTGFFLDQKYNRLAVARICGGMTVLDCLTHTGSFALNALKGGAKSVTAVDVSEFACEAVKKNAERNGLSDRLDVKCADVFELLPELCEQHAKYDMIILDPPAFTKSRRTVSGAERGYREINYRAMKLLPRGGYLATCSCSHFMSDELFIKTVMLAAKDAGFRLKLIEFRHAAPDHPILLGVPETNYLKFCLFQTV